MIQIEAKGNQIFLFGRNDDKSLYCKQIKDFRPYFYVEDSEGDFVSIRGKKLKKITCNFPYEIKKQRDFYSNTYEADILYVNRYLIDHTEVIKKCPIRIFYIDIEIQKTINGYESFEKATNPILCVGCYDSFTEEYKQFVLKDYETEKQMMEEFIKYFNIIDPDMLIAWNGDGFDFPFIINRCVKLGIDINKFARRMNGFNGECHRKENTWGLTKIEGRILFDLMYAYKKFVSGEGRESFSLDYISKYEGVGEKVKHKEDLNELYEKDIKRFLEYNLKDVELMVSLNNKLRIVDFFDELRILTNCRFDDVFMNSKMADSLCLSYAKQKNFVLPTVNKSTNDGSFEGGLVKDSIPGLHQNVACMDMKSLYPSIMIGFNTSYETVLDKYEVDCINVDNKYFYKQDLGIIPSIVKPLLEKRKLIAKELNLINDRGSREYKTLWMTQYTLKTIANSFYGVLGFPKFRLYRKEVAESVTYIARKIIMEVHKWFEDRGFKVIYGDTDSCFVEMNDKSVIDFVELNKEINNYFKTYFLKFGVYEKNNIFKLEFEKVYKTVFFKQKNNKEGAKKRYAGRVIWNDGENCDDFYRRGFESRRSDSPEVGRRFIDDILKMIVWETDKQEIEKFIEEFKVKIQTEFTPEQIAIPIGISKPLHKYTNQIHAKAARLGNQKHNLQIQSGDKIKYIYVKNNDRVIGFKSEGYMPDGYQVDYKMMIRRLVDLKVGPLFDSLGWNNKYVSKLSKKKEKIKLLKDIMRQNELW